MEECEEQMVKVEVERWERNASVVWFEKEETKTMPEYLEMRGNVIFFPPREIFFQCEFVIIFFYPYRNIFF